MGALILNAIDAQVAENLLCRGQMPVVGFGGNLPEGKEHNGQVLEELRQRIRSRMRLY